MPGLNPVARNAMLNATAAVWPPDTVSLHPTDPGNADAVSGSEVAGGSPAYARKAVTWAAAAAGSKSSNAAVTFDVPGGGTVIRFLGYWRGSTYLGSRPLDADQTYSTQGTYTIASGSITESIN